MALIMMIPKAVVKAAAVINLAAWKFMASKTVIR